MQHVLRKSSEPRVIGTGIHTVVVFQRCRHICQHLIAQDTLLARLLTRAPAGSPAYGSGADRDGAPELHRANVPDRAVTKNMTSERRLSSVSRARPKARVDVVAGVDVGPRLESIIESHRGVSCDDPSPVRRAFGQRVGAPVVEVVCGRDVIGQCSSAETVADRAMAG